MFKTIWGLFRAENLLAQAKEEVLEMLKEDLEMFKDSVKCLWTPEGEGISLDEIKRRDKQINRHVRDVRKKALTHLAFSGASELDTALVLLSMVVYIERIGDHTKDITSLATDYPGKFNAGGFEEDLKDFERTVADRLTHLVEIVEEEDKDQARHLAGTHSEVDAKYRGMLDRLINREDNGLSPSQSVMLVLYLRYLRRIEGHIFNLASAEINPFHRIGFKAKKKEKK